LGYFTRWILRYNLDYPDLLDFSFLRFFLDFQYYSRQKAFLRLPLVFLKQCFSKVYNFGSGSRGQSVEYPLSYESLENQDLLGPGLEPAGPYDLVLALEVLEHVREPQKEIEKLRSLLKEGGYLLITTPFLARHHNSPVDVTRWTEFGLIHLVEEAGFSVVSSCRRGSRWSVLGSVTNWIFFHWIQNPLRIQFFLGCLFFPLFFLFYLLGFLSLVFFEKDQTFHNTEGQKLSEGDYHEKIVDQRQKDCDPFYLGVTLLAQKK
jgi:SAM-dependent methyltransferase